MKLDGSAEEIPSEIADSLHKVLDRPEGEEFTIEELVTSTKGHSLELLILLLALPFPTPIPIPVISAPFGFAIMCLALQGTYSNNAGALPQRIREVKVSGNTLKKCLKAATRFLGFWERRSRPWGGLLTKAPFPQINLIMIAWAGFVLALPLPVPFINGIPAWCILLTTFGQMKKDDRFIIAGYLSQILLLGYLGTLAFLGYEIINWSFFE